MRGGMRRKPGEEWQYCNFGVMVLGAVIEKVTGVKAEDFIIRHICTPLRMSDTNFKPTADVLRFGIMLQQNGRLDNTRVLGKMAVKSMTTQRLFGVPDYCWGANTAERRYGLGVDMRRFDCSLTSPGTYFHEGSGHSVLIIDPVEEMVCACVYPWVNGEWNGECNNRLYNVMWSGII